ncbi:MAG TPA: GvpL/GvpF family gas vesicle protein, partial [Pyrinomonadaceae bacterium]|nr:GvpL/GvpF family gas vesicle protein [Pyrinomonadaceae bacterium]
MNLYVYCLGENVAELNQPVTGISGAKVELIELEGFKLLVSEFDGNSAPVTRENVLTHDAVVRSVLDVTT